MTIPSRGRHRIHDPDETTMLPRVIEDEPPADVEVAAEPTAADRTPGRDSAPAPSPADTPTTIIPAVPGDTPTTIIPVVPADTPTTIIPVFLADPSTAGSSPSPRPEQGPRREQGPQPDQAAGTSEQTPTGTSTVAAAVRPLEAQHTTVLPAVRDGQPTGEEKKEPPRKRWGEVLVPLRAKRTPEGYQSVHSELTRTTAATIVRGTARGLGEVLITLGVVALLLFAYEMWGTTAEINAQQDDMARQLEQQWTSDPTVGASAPPTAGPSAAAKPPPPPVNGIAILHIPKLQNRWVVVEGVRQVDIVRNPGHYPRTAMPGQPGNFAVAGHRNRGTFWDLDRLKPCPSDCGSADKIIVETGQYWLIYKVSQQRIVLPSATEVVSPVPPGETAGKLLTLTTCHPLMDNYQRLIVHARLVKTQPKSAGRPAELGG